MTDSSPSAASSLNVYSRKRGKRTVCARRITDQLTSGTWELVVMDNPSTLPAGEWEAEVKEGRMAITAPLARGLIGKSVGDSVEISTPKGEKSYEIVGIEYG